MLLVTTNTVLRIDVARSFCSQAMLTWYSPLLGTRTTKILLKPDLCEASSVLCTRRSYLAADGAVQEEKA